MKSFRIYFCIVLLGLLILFSCERDVVYFESDYYSTLSFADSSANHPKAAKYQKILDEFVENGGIGMSVMIRDEYGVWLGAAGYADIKSNIKLNPASKFLIASISKTFSATVAFLLIEEGIINLDDPVNKWIPHEITDKIDNANESTIKNLLGHTSSIRDIYNSNHLMPYMNNGYHNWCDKDMLKFVYGKQAYFDVGTWQYSNINYILLGMIMENATGKSLKELYEEKIFLPLNLQSAYYNTGTERIAPGLVKGYTDVYSNNTFIEATEFYEDDIGIGGDGGIAINAQDLGKFLDELMKGNILSDESLAKMMDWFNGGYSYNGLAGYGLFYNEYDYGGEVNNSGGIIGFEAGMTYFNEKDVTIIQLTNTDLILTTSDYDDIYSSFSVNLKKAVFNE